MIAKILTQQFSCHLFLKLKYVSPFKNNILSKFPGFCCPSHLEVAPILGLANFDKHHSNSRYSMCKIYRCVYTSIYSVTSLSGCQHPVGLSRGKAKVCYYSGWYYCQNCHQDNSFLIPARLLHNWDTSKHKVSKYTHARI